MALVQRGVKDTDVLKHVVIALQSTQHVQRGSAELGRVIVGSSGATHKIQGYCGVQLKCRVPAVLVVNILQFRAG